MPALVFGQALSLDETARVYRTAAQGFCSRSDLVGPSGVNPSACGVPRSTCASCRLAAHCEVRQDDPLAAAEARRHADAWWAASGEQRPSTEDEGLAEVWDA
jgi:hypothetical protein